MIIELGQEFFVDISDGYNYTLKQRYVVTGENSRGKKAKEESIGQERERTITFHNSLEGAVNKAIKEGLKQCDTMDTALKFVNEINKALESAATLSVDFRSEKKNLFAAIEDGV